MDKERRAKIMREIADGLNNVSDFAKVYRALHLCNDSRLSLEEARDAAYHIGRKVNNLKSKPDGHPTTLALATVLVNKWAAEDRAPRV